ncbi:hypothetical protein ANCDUO_01787 [Ancylostoma duodenale]|uniref:Uncharacterized protein n=1 Tax=Ancylostoma duodenale TaxID=51022 RepID=A0A0C2DY38_9BILA|nr:hypothetical protein ANCDUO_01787 [Ancylostoma duodenale]
MGSLGVGRIFQVVQKPTLRLPFSDLAFVSTLPEDYLPDLVRGKTCTAILISIWTSALPYVSFIIDGNEKSTFSYLIIHFFCLENIGRVKWDELRRDGDEILEEDVIPKAPLWKRALKLLKILLPHVGLNVLLLSYIAMGAIMFIWLEAENELKSRKVSEIFTFT